MAEKLGSNKLKVKNTHPCLYRGVFVWQEAEVEVARTLPVECESIRTLCGIGGNKVFQE